MFLACKIVSFLCSLDNFLPKNVIVFFSWTSNLNGAYLKGLFLTYFSFFFCHQGKDTQNSLSHISRTYTYVFCADIFAFPILQKMRIYHVLFLFGATPGVISYSRHFGAFNRIIKWWAKFKLECLLMIFIYTNAKFTVICKTPDFEWW